MAGEGDAEIAAQCGLYVGSILLQEGLAVVCILLHLRQRHVTDRLCVGVFQIHLSALGAVHLLALPRGDIHQWRLVFGEPATEPADHLLLDIKRSTVAVLGIILTHPLGTSKRGIGALQFVESPQGTPMVDKIVFSVEHNEGFWRHHECHIGYLYALGTLVGHLLASVGGTNQFQGTFPRGEEQCDTGTLNALVEGGQIGALRSTAREAIGSDAVRVDFAAGEQIVDGPAIVEILLCRQAGPQQQIGHIDECMLGGHAPCQRLSLGIVELKTLTLRQRVHHHHGDAVDRHAACQHRTITLAVETMSAHLDTGWYAPANVVGQIQVSGDVASLCTLEDNLLHMESITLNAARDLRPQVSPLWQFTYYRHHPLAGICYILQCQLFLLQCFRQ